VRGYHTFSIFSALFSLCRVPCDTGGSPASALHRRHRPRPPRSVLSPPHHLHASPSLPPCQRGEGRGEGLPVLQTLLFFSPLPLRNPTTRHHEQQKNQKPESPSPVAAGASPPSPRSRGAREQKAHLTSHRLTTLHLTTSPLRHSPPRLSPSLAPRKRGEGRGEGLHTPSQSPLPLSLSPSPPTSRSHDLTTPTKNRPTPKGIGPLKFSAPMPRALHPLGTVIFRRQCPPQTHPDGC